MKVCELSFALLFSFCIYGVHGRADNYEREIQPNRSDVEASSVDDEEEIHVNDPEVVSLSTLVVDQLNHEKLEDDDPLLLLEIVKAATQVISGNLTMLTLKVSQGGVKGMCEVKILDEPWSHKIELVHSKCGTIPAKYEPQAITDGNSAEELDVGNAEVVQLSTIALNELNKEIVEGKDINNLLEIVKASVQPVSGKTTNLILTLKVSQGHVIKMCEVTIEKQIWSKEIKVTESKCENEINETVIEASNESHVSNYYHTETSVNNQSPMETSAFEYKEREAANAKDIEIDLDVNDPEVVSLSVISVNELNDGKHGGDPPFNLSKIVKGVLHKHSGKVTLTLKVLQGGIEDTCEINLWEGSVIDKLYITHSKCGTVAATTEIRNTKPEDEELDVNDPEVVRLSMMAMVDLNEHNQADDPINLLEIVKVSTHIGSGNSTSLTLKVSQGRDKKMCDVKILEKFGSSIPQIFESRCETIKNEEMHPINHQATKDPGVHNIVAHVSGETQTHDNYTKASHSFIIKDDERKVVDSLEEEEELDVNDPEVIHLSTLAMVTLNDEKLKEDDSLILLEIVKAATNLHSGNSTLLTLKVSQGGTKYLCELEFWPQPDMAKTKVKHSQCGTVPAKFKTEGADTAHLFNGVEKLEVNDPTVIRLSMISLVELYDKYPTNDPVNLLEIVKASRQIVSGILTSLTLKVSQGHQRKMCDIHILEQPWLKITKINHAECEDIQEKGDKLLEIYGVNGITRIIPLSESVSSW